MTWGQSSGRPRTFLATEVLTLAAILSLFSSGSLAQDDFARVRRAAFVLAFADDDKEAGEAKAEEGVFRQRTTTNLKHLMLALHNHHDAMKKLPAAYRSKDGKPLLSWRVALLPYIEQQPLYAQFHLDEPWDSEHNKQLIAKMPALYRDPLSENEVGYTVYLTPRGESTAFPGAKALGFRDILDGTSNTIAIVEVGDDYAVPWTKPDDWNFDPDEPTAELGGHYKGGFHVALCDGSVHFVPSNVDPAIMKGMFTRAGGERVKLPQ